MNKRIFIVALAVIGASGMNMLSAQSAYAVQPKVGACDGGDRFNKDGTWHADKTCPRLGTHPSAGVKAAAIKKPGPGCVLRPANPLEQACAKQTGQAH